MDETGGAAKKSQRTRRHETPEEPEKAPEEPERVAAHQEGPGQVRQHRHGAAGRLSVIVPQTWGRCGIVQHVQHYPAVPDLVVKGHGEGMTKSIARAS